MSCMSKVPNCIGHLTATIFVMLLLAGTTANPRGIQSMPKRPVHKMISSYYGPGFHGRPTASGAHFDQTALTAAHRTLPFGTRLRLTNPKTQLSVTVEITDRGPYSEFAGVRYYKDPRDLDVSQGAAQRLGFERDGVTTLLVEFLSDTVPSRTLARTFRKDQ